MLTMSSHPRARRIPLLLAPAVFLLLAGCATETASTSAPSTSPVTTPSASGSAGPHDAAWSYEGATAPGHWGSLAADYGTCSAGSQQSPIDLPAPVGGPALDLTSSSVAGQTADNGHTVQFTADSGAVTTIDGEQLDLVQMHFHAGPNTPSRARTPQRSSTSSTPTHTGR
jgi:carbonic anhydrase